MRVLWMKPTLPFPPHQGTRRVSLQFLETVQRDHEVWLHTRLEHPRERAAAEDLQQHLPGLRLSAPVAPNRRSPFHRVWHRWYNRRRAAAGVPPVEAYAAPRELVRAFAEAGREFQPDLVVAEYWYSRPFLDAVEAPHKVLLAHDLDFRVRASGVDIRRERLRDARWAKLEEDREKLALRTAERLWVLTETDRDGAVAEAGADPARTSVMPYGIDLTGLFAAPGEMEAVEEPGRVLLFGSFAADFNRDALRFTLDDIWPRVRADHPEARLTVAGGGLPKDLIRAAREAGAEVRGRVDDLRGLLLSAAVVLVPLRFGGGLRIRLLESLALERAVVGTPAGVLGMGPREDQEVLAAPDAQGLAGAVVRLLREPARRRQIGRAGRTWVMEHRSLERARAQQRERVAQALGLPAAGD